MFQISLSRSRIWCWDWKINYRASSKCYHVTRTSVFLWLCWNETGFHSDLPDLLISEIIVKADFVNTSTKDTKIHTYQNLRYYWFINFLLHNNHKQFSSVLWILILCDINYCSINENIRYELIESTLLRFISYKKIIKWIYRVKTYIHYMPLWNKIKKTNNIQLKINSSAWFLNSFLCYLSWLRGIVFCFSISKMYSVIIHFHFI